MKPLAEWFWTDRWDGSSAALLPLEARGLYREMLTQAWRRDGRLPSAPESIKRAVRCTDAEWDRCWPLVKPYWREADGWLTNDTQIEVLVETKRQMEARSNRGAAAARKRWECSSNAQALPKHMLTQSPSNALRSPDLDLSPDQDQIQPTSGGPDGGGQIGEDQNLTDLTEKPSKVGMTLPPLALLWNEKVAGRGLPTVRSWTAARDRTAKTRLREEPDLAVWGRAIDVMLENPWNTGTNPGKWTATFDYLIAPSKAGRLLDAGRAAAEPQAPPVDDYEDPRVRRQRESDAAVLKVLQGELDAGRSLSDRDAERYARLIGTGVAS